MRCHNECEYECECGQFYQQSVQPQPQHITQNNRQQKCGQMLIENIRVYAGKLTGLRESEQQSLQQLRHSYLQQFEVQLNDALKFHQQNYIKNKHMLKQEMETLEYYIKLYHKCYGNQQHDGQQQQQQQQQQLQNNFMSTAQTQNQWQKVTESLNLYSLFKLIDDKLVFNRALLQDFKIVCSLPSSQHNQFSAMVQASSILHHKCKEYEALISSLLTKFNRPCKQELAMFQDIKHKYRNLIANQQTTKATELKIKESMDYCISSISGMKYLRTVEIEAVENRGIMSIQSYQELGQALYLHRFYLKQVRVRIMDMEFCQEKCDTLKRYLKKLRVLQKLIIHNYYAECKLGNFVDFNWHPYRKAVNIKACVWK